MLVCMSHSVSGQTSSPHLGPGRVWFRLSRREAALSKNGGAVDFPWLFQQWIEDTLRRHFFGRSGANRNRLTRPPPPKATDHDPLYECPRLRGIKMPTADRLARRQPFSPLTPVNATSRKCQLVANMRVFLLSLFFFSAHLFSGSAFLILISVTTTREKRPAPLPPPRPRG